MKILVTGFDPFGNDKINPAFEIVKKLPKSLGNASIITLEVPTVFNKSIIAVTDAISQKKPDIIICLGQAGGRFGITPERVAINIDDARIKDNEGNQPLGEKIEPTGENAYFSTLPVKEITKAIQDIGIPSSVSNTAGTFVCNHLMYGVLHYIQTNTLNIRAGFIHIPYLVEQTVDKIEKPGLTLETMTSAIEEAIRVCATNHCAINYVSGELH